jgi:hypothetical protein
MTGYRLGPWRSYRYETGIIRTIMIWRGDIGRKIFRKVAILSKKNIMPLMLFYGKNLAQFVFMFETRSYCESGVPTAGVTRI